MLFYAVRERELLLNINELIAGFRFFPSYIRIGGLREDLPRGFHEAVNAFLDRFPGKIDEFEGLLTKNDIFRRRTEGVGVVTLEDDAMRGDWSARSRAPPGPTTTSASTSRTRLRDLRLQDSDRDRGRRLRAVSRPRGRDARERQDLPAGDHAYHAHRGLRVRRHARGAAAEGQGLHRDGSADSALPHILAGLHRAGRRRLCADRGSARRAWHLHRVRRLEPAVAREDACAVVHGDSGAARRSSRAVSSPTWWRSSAATTW